jgi:LacI family transcriptional regulator
MTSSSIAPAHHRPTMRDVAALSGVSLKTVSRVVNGEAGVSDDLTERVEAAARTLNYQPNLTASNLRRNDGKTRTIGLLLDSGADVNHRANSGWTASMAAGKKGRKDIVRLIVTKANQRTSMASVPGTAAAAGTAAAGIIKYGISGT